MCNTVVFVYDCGHKLLVRLGCEVKNFYLCDIEKTQNSTKIKNYDCCCCEERMDNLRLAVEAKSKALALATSPEPEKEQNNQSYMQMTDIPMRNRLSGSEKERVESWIRKHNEAVEIAESEQAAHESGSG